MIQFTILPSYAHLVMWQLKISLPINLYNLTEFPPTNINFASTEAELHSHCHVDDGMLFRYLYYILGARRTVKTIFLNVCPAD